VYDQIKKVKAKLLEYEKVLSWKDKYGELKSLKGELSLEVYEKILDIIGR
jgi:predicted DNA-binding protein YlxM (UPF0122 family)